MNSFTPSLGGRTEKKSSHSRGWDHFSVLNFLCIFTLASCPASSVNGEANSWLSEIIHADMTLECLIPSHTKTPLQYSRPCSSSISRAHIWAYRFFSTPWMKGTCDKILSCFLEGISHQYKLFIKGTHIIYVYFQITYNVIAVIRWILYRHLKPHCRSDLMCGWDILKFLIFFFLHGHPEWYIERFYNICGILFSLMVHKCAEETLDWKTLFTWI